MNSEKGDSLTWQLQQTFYRKTLRPLALTRKRVNTTTVFQLLPLCARVCSALLIACLEVRRKPRISCKTFGCDGTLRIGERLRTRLRTWRQQLRDCVSI